ncbi:MAG: phosphoenolpyruvate synthase, partial [Cyanobacteriota bacterium]
MASHSPDQRLVVPFDQVGLSAIPEVGGKNASLGEMIRSLKPQGVQVPDGFATTAAAYRLFLAANELGPALDRALAGLDVSDLGALQAAGRACRELVLSATLPSVLVEQILEAYGSMAADQGSTPAVAVRSSATAEDLPEASFAGQQETFLHVVGEAALLRATQRCYASLFTDRAISYRQHHGFRHDEVALSVGVQEMVRSDLAAAGVMFTLDTETGFRDVVLLTAAYGLGENVVQGAVNPDEWLIHKPTLAQGFAPIISRQLGSKALRMVYSEDRPGEGQAVSNQPVPEAERQRYALTDAEALTLARWACVIESHYSAQRGTPTPMDLEWAKDGLSGELFILQARPETVESRRGGAVLRSWHLLAEGGEPIVTGRAIGASISSGSARVIQDPSEIDRFQPGELLITRRTDPDWEPILKKAKGVVTDQGGRTCHAAIIAREMGITAIVGTGEATQRIQDGQPITVSCCEGDVGQVYPGLLDFEVQEQTLDNLPATRTQVLMNVGNPEEAFQLAAIPCDGVGLARLEFIIANQIKVHPLALLAPEKIASPQERDQIAQLTSGYGTPGEYYVDLLSQGMARIAA